MTGITLLAGLYAQIEYSKTGADDWALLPGMSEYSESGGDRPTEDVVTFDGVGKIAGQARTPTITANAQYLPHLQGWKDVRSAYVDGTPLWIRITSKEDVLYETATGTVAIATTGIVTFAGTAQPITTSDTYAVGNVIKHNNKGYVIDTISKTGVFTVKPAPASAVAASANYKIVAPSIRRTFRADVTLADRISVTPEGTMTTTINLSPRSQLPAPELVI